MFTMYYLLIKTGLIGPTVVKAFDPLQQNQQLVAKAGVLPVFHPYISALDDDYYRPSALPKMNYLLGILKRHEHMHI